MTDQRVVAIVTRLPERIATVPSHARGWGLPASTTTVMGSATHAQTSARRELGLPPIGSQPPPADVKTTGGEAVGVGAAVAGAVGES